ncbi:hypothetical protein [Helicobacter cetorum]|uniref:hypothetical protein n=1 Tax=Helicobacter cetorum TaxID=138563 RepID=UPI000CF13781|nr:hypothetical protein [Helicobacter cetorum]
MQKEQKEFDPLIYQRYLKKQQEFKLFQSIGEKSALKNLKTKLKQRQIIHNYITQSLEGLSKGFRYAKIEQQTLKIFFTHTSYLKAFKIQENYYTNNLRAHFLETKKMLESLNYSLLFTRILASVREKTYQKPPIAHKAIKTPITINIDFNTQNLSDFTKEQFLKLKQSLEKQQKRS